MRPSFDFDITEWTDDGEFVLKYRVFGTDHNGNPFAEERTCHELVYPHEIAAIIAKANNSAIRY